MSERVTERSDGTTTERVVERDAGAPAYVERRGGAGGVGAVIVGVAVLALVAIIAVFLLNQNRNDAIRTNAVTSAASSIADSTAGAAKDVGSAANRAADGATGTVTPSK